jgi:hypothetical protein
MQDGATKSRMNTLMRILLVTPLTLLGCLFYFAAPMIGSGVHLEPMPGMGMLLAGTALVFMLGGYWLVRSEKGADILANIIDAILVLGALSLVYGVVLWGYETIHRVQSSEWGHSRPGEVLFRVSYGTFSVAGFAVFHYWVRKASISSQP